MDFNFRWETYCIKKDRNIEKTKHPYLKDLIEILDWLFKINASIYRCEVYLIVVSLWKVLYNWMRCF